MYTDLERAINNSIESHNREYDGHLYEASSYSNQNDEFRNSNTDNPIEKRLGVNLAAMKIKVNCPCNGLYKTRILHNLMCPKMNEISQQEWNQLKLMKCLYCKKIQNINKKCIHCNKVLAKYYCKKCNLLLNNDSNLFLKHCNLCNLCIYSIDNKNHHCKKCNTCHSSDIKCSQVNDNCPYCLENIFNSSPNCKNVTYKNHLKKLNCCGNFVHTGCFKNSNSNTCPLCRKNIT